MAQKHFYEFGPFRIDVALSRLERGGEVLPLPPKAFDLLLLLVHNSDRVMSKRELMEALWPGTFVEEANLTQHIYTLRRTLGDQPDGKPYIETTARRGYRFAAAVREVPAKPAAGRDEGREDQRSRMRPVAIAVVAAGVAMLAAAGLWQIARVRSSLGDIVAGKTRVAVLPFENLTGNRADDWLASAFSDSLTAGLENVDGVICVSRDRIVELYRQHSINDAAPVDAQIPRKLSEAFGLRYYVHGTYQRIGDQIKVVARLVDDSGTIRAQETLTDAVTNLLRVEDALATRFAAKLQVQSQPSAARSDTPPLEAYQAFIEGRNSYAATRLQEAVAPLVRATTIDPRYAEAWAVLSKVNSRLSTITFYSSGSVEQFHADALKFGQRAADLAPSLYDAHVALALAYRQTGDVDRWRTEARAAIKLNPRIAEAYELLADSYFAGNAFGCRRDRNAAIAEENFEKAIQIDPQLPNAYGNLSYHLSWLGRSDEALRIADEGLAAIGPNPAIVRARGLALARLGRANEADRDLRALIAARNVMSAEDHIILGGIALARGDGDLGAKEFDTAISLLPSTAFHLAAARAYLDNGRVDAGLIHLDKAVALDPTCAAFVATSPAFAPHRETPQLRTRLAGWK